MRVSSVVHAIAFRIGDGRYAWPLCPSGRGPWPVVSPRLTWDHERVTCLRCLDHLTRP